ncbi:DUF3558 domain-containing protein [Rhodococcus sp. SGAir0479]|uniref:DUF3558 domain-containing protein n=1 Tax=Rhodococcus sp. SGAir0479 TaxID=2567884 RepID=UPI0010CCC128|nr:DUF3558 domain-containing protein [Rhodococcus sp. SGAir0479]QCQ92242.1 DUF3558 domain-containing protein [Rhodococcus sp. SGAir0479]
MSRTVVGLLVGCAVLLAGCGGGGGEQAGDHPGSPTGTSQSPSAPGPFFGECGSVTDAEVAAAFGVPGFGTVVRNSVGCEWQLSAQDAHASPHVSFTWYRGSPIGRERAGSALVGRPAIDIEIGGRPGFEAASSEWLCELGVQFGDDFVHWSIAYADGVPAAEPCDVGRRLAELTVARAR